MQKIFSIISKINNVLAFVALLAIAGIALWLLLANNSTPRRGAIVAHETSSGKQAPILLNLEKAEAITGANTLMLRLSAQANQRGFSSGGYGSETRNVLFLSGENRAPRWLFAGHKNLVLESRQLPSEDDSVEKNQPTKALYFEFVDKDSNRDGNLSNEDNSSLALSKPDGSGLVIVLRDINRVLSFDLLEAQLSVVYQQGPAVKHAIISLSDMRLKSDRMLINVPGSI